MEENGGNGGKWGKWGKMGEMEENGGNGGKWGKLGEVSLTRLAVWGLWPKTATLRGILPYQTSADAEPLSCSGDGADIMGQHP